MPNRENCTKSMSKHSRLYVTHIYITIPYARNFITKIFYALDNSFNISAKCECKNGSQSSKEDLNMDELF